MSSSFGRWLVKSELKQENSSVSDSFGCRLEVCKLPSSDEK